jgi:hypothetical protein
MTEQTAAGYDFKPEESWLEEQLFDSPGVEIPTRESPIKIYNSHGTSHFFCYFILTFLFLLHSHLCFSFIADPSMPTDPPEVADVPVLTLVASAPDSETSGYIPSLFSFLLFIMAGYMTCFFVL